MNEKGARITRKALPCIAILAGLWIGAMAPLSVRAIDPDVEELEAKENKISCPTLFICWQQYWGQTLILLMVTLRCRNK